MKKIFRPFALASFVLVTALTRASSAEPLAVGAHASAITLTDREEAKLDLVKAFAEKPAVLVFYRGSWGPFCNRQLAALGELKPRLQAPGYQILAVSPDAAEGLKKWLAKKLIYRRLSDHAMDASLAYGTAFRVSTKRTEAHHRRGIDLTPIAGGESTWLPMPTMFIVDRDGVINFRFSDPDYNVRLSSEALFAARSRAAK